MLTQKFQFYTSYKKTIFTFTTHFHQMLGWKWTKRRLKGDCDRYIIAFVRRKFDVTERSEEKQMTTNALNEHTTMWSLSFSKFHHRQIIKMKWNCHPLQNLKLRIYIFFRVSLSSVQLSAHTVFTLDHRFIGAHVTQSSSPMSFRCLCSWGRNKSILLMGNKLEKRFATTANTHFDRAGARERWYVKK